jgi:hypothetical protein
MSSPPQKRARQSNFFLEYPGVTAVVFAIGVVALFLGVLLGPVLSGEEHAGPQAEPARSGAPAASTPKK